jgi:hypothetical protein
MKYLPGFFLSLLIYSCTQNDPGVDTWRLGWRMTLNLMEDNDALAVMQFDSLLALGEALDPQFLSAGMASMLMQGRDEEVEEIFSTLDETTKRKTCQSNTVGGAPFCADYASLSPANSALSRKLIQLYVNDQAVRGNVMDNVMDRHNIQPDSTLIPLGMRVVDQGNREQLSTIIDEFGFPTLELVGRDAMRGVFLIIQHADRDPAWQKAQLPFVEAAVEAGDMDGQDYAYLYDRIQVNSGLPQRYGTQFARVDLGSGVAELAETEDPDNLDARRRSMGLMPIEMYRKLMLSVPQ